MRALLLLALFCTSAAAAPVPKDVNKERLVGLWKVKSVTLNGEAQKVNFNDTNWTFDENFALTRAGTLTGTHHPTQLKVDATTRELDWPVGSDMWLGRYEVKGDQLTICLSTKNRPRPTTLEPDVNNYVWVLNRGDK